MESKKLVLRSGVIDVTAPEGVVQISMEFVCGRVWKSLEKQARESL
jgi:hypothetical protein